MIEIIEHQTLTISQSGIIVNDIGTNTFTNTIKPKGIDSFSINNHIVLKEPSSILNIKQVFYINEIEKVKYFNRYHKWEQLNKRENITAYQFLQMELKKKDGSYINVYNNIPFTCSIYLSNNTLELTIIHDAPFLHTTWDYASGQRASSAIQKQPAGTQFQAILYIKVSENPIISILPSFYPSNTKSCFILTDHCDFDTIEKLQLFVHGNNNNGWIHKGLKITKGVFRFSPKEKEQRKSDDLEIPLYKKLIDELHNDGSEICPHALKHSGQLSSQDFNNGINYLHQNYEPKTWIDHGSYLKYCYSQNGHHNSEYKLLQTLKEKDYNNLWSFHDVATDPSLSLNYFHSVKYNKLHGAKMILGHIFQGNIFYALHYFRSFIHKSFGKSAFIDFINYSFACSKSVIIAIAKNKKHIYKETKKFIQNLIHFNRFRTNVKEFFTLDDLNQYLSPIFTENYQTINNYKSGLLFFNTIETTHTKDIYTEKLLNKLIDERGLHLGHTYILNSLPYVNGIFEFIKGELVLSKKWITFTEVLSAKIKSGEIWNPNMSEFIERIKLLLNVTFDLAGNEIHIKNNNKIDVIGYSFIDSNNIEHCLNLKPLEEVTIKL